jgi:hypothetical protein
MIMQWDATREVARFERELRGRREIARAAGEERALTEREELQIVGADSRG